MKHLALALLLGTAPALVAQTPPADPTLTAMQAELTREKAALQLPGLERPYFIEYRLDDLKSFEALANYGAGCPTSRF